MSETRCARCAELMAELEQERKWHYEQSDKAHAAESALSAERTARRVLREALEGLASAIRGYVAMLAVARAATTTNPPALKKAATEIAAALAEADAALKPRCPFYPEKPGCDKGVCPVPPPCEPGAALAAEPGEGPATPGKNS